MAVLDFLQKIFGHDSSTRAASVELWVVIPALLLLVKFAVGSMGPRFVLARQISPGIELLRILSYYSVSYTLGLMKPSVSTKDSAPTANDLFQVWAVLIVTMQDGARIGRPYKPKEMTMVDLLTSLWSANQLRASTALYLKVPLWMIWSIHASRIIWYYVSSNGAAGASEDNMKLVSDYMASSQHTADGDRGTCPATMAGYKYLVLGEDQLEKEIEKPRFRLKLDLQTRPEELVTLEKVWGHSRLLSEATTGGDDKLLGRDGDSRFKDVCLSFALYKLLRRRFFDFPMPEAKHPASGRLVSDGILSTGGDGNDYERAFRVTEVELSYLQDFSYSKHAVVFAHGFPTHRVMLSLLMTAAALYLAYAVRDVPSTSMARTTDGKVATITRGVFVTHCLIAIVVTRELWEVGVYVLSQWTKVLIICHYVRLQQRPGWISKLQRPVMEKVARIMFWLIRRGQWDQEIQQYNLLMAARVVLPNRRLRIRLVKLRSEVKAKIFESLKSLISLSSRREHNDPINPSESFVQGRKNDALRSYLGQAFGAASGSPPPSIDAIHGSLEGETHKILAWHVATSLCQIKLLEEAERRGDLYALPTTSGQDPAPRFAAVWPHYVAAVTLSNYCVHLVTEALLPDNGLVADTVLDAVRDEARDALRGCRTRKKIYDRLVAATKESDGPDGPSIVKIGAQLSVELVSTYVDKVELWERLGRFWAGFLLHLSASTRAAKHRIHLQGRAELTTHLWALLSHAGFLGETTHGQQLLDPVDLGAA